MAASVAHRWKSTRERTMRSKWIWALLTVIASAGVLYATLGQGSEKGTSYRFVEVELGTVEQVVASTGTMQATETVEVGTQVSGLLSEIRVDFNDQVSEGDLLARIDPTILQQEVKSAEASLARSQAELDQASRTLVRVTELLKEKVVADSDMETAQYQYDVASASFEQAQVALDRTQRNLEYTQIRAPIDGVVIERAVEAGQTVAASMSAPVLFVLAGDLSEMEILASVDESDIGLIHQGQEVRFTVQAYSSESFPGKVSQVRLQSSVMENVVTYDVVIDVANVDGRLLPGMTATVEFIVARAEEVFKVSNSALRFSPTESMVAGLAASREENRGAERRDPTGQPPSPLFFLDEDGKLAVAHVETGITDGQSTVINGPQIAEGMRIIAAVATGAAAAASNEAASNPFQSQAGNRPPGGPQR